MPEEKITIRNNSGENLKGIFHKCGTEMKIVIVCHGFTSTKEHKLVKGICSALEKKGTNSFRFDFSGKGESQGEFGKSTYTKEAKDLEAVLDYFGHMGFETPCVAGHGMGGVVALMQAANDRRIESAIGIAGITYPERIIERFGKDLVEKCMREGEAEYMKGGKKFVLKKEFFDDALKMDLFHTIKKVNVPVLFVYGEKDEEVPLSQMQKLFEKAYQPKGLKVFDDANHSFTKKEHLKEASELCATWAARQAMAKQ